MRPTRKDNIDIGWCHCPVCKKWVPETSMNRDYDDDGQLIRMCTPCMEGTSEENDFIYDPHFGETECIYCGSYNTTEQKPKWNWFRCNECGATFRRM